jgi:succinyldiaminopimelate transaminase
MRAGFVPPPYPYDRLDAMKAQAAEVPGGLVDLSIGTPCDPMAPAVVWAMAESADAGIGYPPSIGTVGLREAACGWMLRRLGVVVDPAQVAACVGTKEAVTSLPHHLALRDPSRDTVLYPAVSYPSYAMGAELAGLRAVPIPPDADWHPDLDQVAEQDAARALLLWLNEPANPTGSVPTTAWYERAVRWARQRGIVVASDECYAEFMGGHARTTALTAGTDGVLAVHSLSKRSNMAGMRVGFYAGDGELIHYLAEVRKHAGLMIPGPVQAAAAVALADDEHVEAQLARYAERRARWIEWLERSDLVHDGGPGTFYLWVRAREPQRESRGPDPHTAAWDLARRFAAGGTLVAPGDLYGEADARHVRVALVQPLDRLQLALDRLAPVRAG